MKIKTIEIVPALLLLGVLARFVQVTIGSMGEGNGVQSPDKKFWARAEGSYTKKFWGGTHNYYEFTVESTAGQRIQHILMDEPPQGMMSVRQDGWIEWAPDSSSVTYTLKGARLTLNLKP
jgi:hypothetical protein